MDYLLTDIVNYSQPIESSLFFFHDASTDDQMQTKPTMGQHRQKEDAIFSFSNGNFDDLALFILSARKSGFQGDIVINVPLRSKVDASVYKFLEYHANHGVVVYEGFDLYFTEGDYAFKLERETVAIETAKFE